MDENYDVILLGTGLTECILAGLFAIEGKRVLHIDRNPYYGGASASLNLSQLFQRFRNAEKAPSKYGRDRDFCIDLVPKLMMAYGMFVKMLACTTVTRYLEIKQIAGSFVYRAGKIYKVPSTEMEAVMSPLIGILAKNRARNFFKWISELPDPFVLESTKVQQSGPNIDTSTMAQVYAHFNLDKNVQECIGHAMALHTNDEYLNMPARKTIEAIQLYKHSITRFGVSPYVYPAYGLGELPQAFARISAVHNGTYMLDQPFDGLIYDDNKKVCGIKSGDKTASAPLVFGDPTYFPDRCRKISRVVRAFCLLTHPIKDTGNAHSLQLIIPQSQIKRNHDIFVVCLSSFHMVCKGDYYIAIASTTVTSDNPEQELEAAFNLLEPIEEKFIDVVDLYEPTNEKNDGAFVSRSYDATSHFETVTVDVFDLYKRATGKELILKEPTQATEDEM